MVPLDLVKGRLLCTPHLARSGAECVAYMDFSFIYGRRVIIVPNLRYSVKVISHDHVLLRYPKIFDTSSLISL